MCFVVYMYYKKYLFGGIIMKTNTRENYNIFNDPDYHNASGKIKHLKMIRYRLMKGRENYNKVNNKKLSRKYTIEKLHNNDIDISEQTYDSLFDPTSNRSSIDISAVIYVCQLLDLNVSQVLSFPKETLVDKETEPTFNKFEDYFKVLDDPNYNGTFHFYTLRYSGTDFSFYKEYPDTLCKTEDLIEGTLSFDIQRDSGSIATLDYIQLIPRFDNTTEAKRKNATCIPMLSTLNNNVYLRFVDNDGRTYQIVFDRQEFYSGECYFRIAGMFIESSDHEHFPIFQKMLLLRKELRPEYYDFIKGILNLNQDTIIISPDKLADLTKKDMEIQKFVNCYDEKLHSYKKELLVFNKDIILSDDSEMSTESKESTLLKLQHYTFSQNQVYISGDKHAHKIFKKLQQESDKSDSERHQ